MNQAHYRDESEIADVVGKFEHCEFRLEEFTHARHVTVAAWYLCNLRPDEALKRMRSGLVRFIEHHGRHGYHETITRFWMERIGLCIAQMPADMSVRQKVNEVVELSQCKDVLFEHYTRDRVLSERAKREWVEPDVKAIGCQEQMTRVRSVGSCEHESD